MKEKGRRKEANQKKVKRQKQKQLLGANNVNYFFILLFAYSLLFFSFWFFYFRYYLRAGDEKQCMDEFAQTFAALKVLSHHHWKKRIKKIITRKEGNEKRREGKERTRKTSLKKEINQLLTFFSSELQWFKACSISRNWITCSWFKFYICILKMSNWIRSIYWDYNWEIKSNHNGFYI